MRMQISNTIKNLVTFKSVSISFSKDTTIAVRCQTVVSSFDRLSSNNKQPTLLKTFIPSLKLSFQFTSQQKVV